jgi:glucosyl-3-phosphoglycerate synthase
MVLLMPESDNEKLIALARCLAASEPVLLLGVVAVPESQNLSEGAMLARQLRDLIQNTADRVNLRAKARVRVTYTPWDAVRLALAEEPEVELLILAYPQQLEALRLTAAELLSHPPCDVALFRGPFPKTVQRILVPNLGDPHAQRALRLSLNLARRDQAMITSLHLRPSQMDKQQAALFAGMRQVLGEMPDIEQRTLVSEDRAQTILDVSGDFDVVVMGTKASPTASTDSFGQITDTILQHSPAAVIAVKTNRVIPTADARRSWALAISVLVDRWFA